MRLLVLCAALLAGGCFREYCEDMGKSYCDGDVRHYCYDMHEGGQWNSDLCDDYCVEDDTGAICASEATPRPACAGIESGTIVCDGAERISCVRGYATVKYTCPAPELCEPSVPLCTTRPGPQAACMFREGTEDPYPYPPSYCDGNTWVRCSGQFAIQEKDCGAMGCYENVEVAGCLLASAPDPLCTNATARYPYRSCANNGQLECLGAYRIGFYPCASGACGSCQQ
jgi:hypothetical protein